MSFDDAEVLIGEPFNSDLCKRLAPCVTHGHRMINRQLSVRAGIFIQ
jgi:hypothetical protein